MKKIQIALIVFALLLLGACADQSNQAEQEEKNTDDEKIGFSMTGGSIEEASGVPEDEKEAILEAFNTYIKTFNEQDLEGYLAMIGSNYDVDEEREFIESHFENYEQTREPTNVTIVKYDETEAQVFANLDNHLKQLSTGFETGDKIRQVTVFEKENGDWKVKSVHSIGENEGQQPNNE